MRRPVRRGLLLLTTATVLVLGWPGASAQAAAYLSHRTTVDIFRDAGISIWSSGNCSNRNNASCTSFERIRRSTVDGLLTLRKASKCDLRVTGGTETGHGSGTYTHWNGWKIDISKYDCIGRYIKRYFRYVGYIKGWGYQYKAPSGNIYTDEGNHWDILYYSCGGCSGDDDEPSFTPSPSPSPSAKPSPSASPSATPSAGPSAARPPVSPSPSTGSSASPSTSPSASASVSPSVSPSGSGGPSPSAVAVGPSVSPGPSTSAQPGPSASTQVSSSATPLTSPSGTPWPSGTPSPSASPSPSMTAQPFGSATVPDAASAGQAQPEPPVALPPPPVREPVPQPTKLLRAVDPEPRTPPATMDPAQVDAPLG
ncbi:hypothetical protein Cci01nite_00150 [Catellatospora citrea]|uniref:D-alanyl-D-alanine carboxypeptidase-like protein n=1 Tax=Catellatospora citrea TaxID=53366 RepID=A0A8J3K810_9ACTN|nr:hypothetical protein C8E86_1598 [Catellatospora citrea]GIF94921.1 hypothetical protein Cci01nite_00150 [Catellatospora citrea]